MVQVYYWAAADRIVTILHGRIISIFSLEYTHPQWGWRGMLYSVEHTRSRVAKMKTLTYLGDL